MKTQELPPQGPSPTPETSSAGLWDGWPGNEGHPGRGSDLAQVAWPSASVSSSVKWKHLFTDVQCNASHNIQKMEATHVSISR